MPMLNPLTKIQEFLLILAGPNIIQYLFDLVRCGRYIALTLDVLRSTIALSCGANTIIARAV